MPKRSRYENVTVTNGVVRIYANQQIHEFPSVKNWSFAENTNRFNPEDVEYVISIPCVDGDTTIVCSNEEEYYLIMDELILQGL